MSEMTRREAMAVGAGAVAAAASGAAARGTASAANQAASASNESDGGQPFKVSLAQWSLHRTLNSGDLDNLDFPVVTRERFDLDACEFVNQFFMDKARDEEYLSELKKRANDHGVACPLIMVDLEGRLGDPDESARARAVQNHHKWLAAAALLGCHSIRVNAASEGSFEEQQKLAADGLRGLTEIAAPFGINILVENHGGFSSHGRWLAEVIRMVDHPSCGTLPDFGNFCMDWSRADDPDVWYDRYLGVEQLMPFAKAVSAKSNEFNDAGDEVRTDFRRMMRIVTDAGYRGWVGIEWEGGGVPEPEGVLLTKRLLDRVRDELTA